VMHVGNHIFAANHAEPVVFFTGQIL